MKSSKLWKVLLGKNLIIWAISLIVNKIVLLLMILNLHPIRKIMVCIQLTILEIASLLIRWEIVHLLKVQTVCNILMTSEGLLMKILQSETIRLMLNMDGFQECFRILTLMNNSKLIYFLHVKIQQEHFIQISLMFHFLWGKWQTKLSLYTPKTGQSKIFHTDKVQNKSSIMPLLSVHL